MVYLTFPFSYQDYNVVRRIPNEVGKFWADSVYVTLKNNEGFYCRSFLNGMHSGGGSPTETAWLVAKDENGNYLLASPKHNVDLNHEQ